MVGAGGFGRELLPLIRDIELVHPLAWVGRSVALAVGPLISAVNNSTVAVSSAAATLLTEQPIALAYGTNQLVDPSTLIPAIQACPERRQSPSFASQSSRATPQLWDGQAGERIALVIEEWMQRR